MTTALITGATSGIGRAIATTLASAGLATYAAGRDMAALEALRALHSGIVPVKVDVTDGAALAEATGGLAVDVLVNNAGVMPPPGNFADMLQADIDSALAVNLGAVLSLTRMVVPGMRERGRGHVLFVGSSAGHAPAADIAVYAATKAAIGAFAAGLRADLSANGIRVTEIVPGRVETGLYRSILAPDRRAAMYEGDLALQPEDVAEMVLAAIRLPERACVTRFDLMPTRPVAPLKKG